MKTGLLFVDSFIESLNISQNETIIFILFTIAIIFLIKKQIVRHFQKLLDPVYLHLQMGLLEEVIYQIRPAHGRVFQLLLIISSLDILILIKD